jgi:hypothetical protein
MEAKSLRKKPFTYTRKNVRRESLPLADSFVGFNELENEALGRANET